MLLYVNIHFINKFLYKDTSSREFTENLYTLLNKYNKPQHFYVRVVFEEDNIELEHLVITPRLIADILNEYEIHKRNKYWTPADIYQIKNRLEGDIGCMLIE